jgi:hypothetical protein
MLMNTALLAVAVLPLGLYVGVAWVLVTKYRMTRNAGFLLLGAGLVVWPVLSSIAAMGGAVMIDGLVGGQPAAYPFSLVVNSQASIGEMVAFSSGASRTIRAGLILAGIWSLGRASNRVGAPLGPTAAQGSS